MAHHVQRVSDARPESTYSVLADIPQKMQSELFPGGLAPKFNASLAKAFEQSGGEIPNPLIFFVATDAQNRALPNGEFVRPSGPVHHPAPRHEISSEHRLRQGTNAIQRRSRSAGDIEA